MKPRVAAGISRYRVVGTGPNPTALEFVEVLEDAGGLASYFWASPFYTKQEGKEKIQKLSVLESDFLAQDLHIDALCCHIKYTCKIRTQ